MIIPRIRTNAGSTSNGLFEVSIQDDLGNDQSWLGVLAQEVFEVRWKWRNMLGNLFGGRKWRQDMEIRSHVVELAVATRYDGRSPAAYFDLMLTMLDHPNGYRAKYGYFAGMSRDDIQREMLSRSQAALDWVDEHADFFKAWKQRRSA